MPFDECEDTIAAALVSKDNSRQFTRHPPRQSEARPQGSNTFARLGYETLGADPKAMGDNP
jgi:hypothetical protein